MDERGPRWTQSSAPRHEPTAVLQDQEEYGKITIKLSYHVAQNNSIQHYTWTPVQFHSAQHRWPATHVAGPQIYEGSPCQQRMTPEEKQRFLLWVMAPSSTGPHIWRCLVIFSEEHAEREQPSTPHERSRVRVLPKATESRLQQKQGWIRERFAVVDEQAGGGPGRGSEVGGFWKGMGGEDVYPRSRSCRLRNQHVVVVSTHLWRKRGAQVDLHRHDLIHLHASPHWTESLVLHIFHVVHVFLHQSWRFHLLKYFHVHDLSHVQIERTLCFKVPTSEFLVYQCWLLTPVLALGVCFLELTSVVQFHVVGLCVGAAVVLPCDTVSFPYPSARMPLSRWTLGSQYDICRRNADIERPSYMNLIWLLRQISSSWRHLFVATEGSTWMHRAPVVILAQAHFAQPCEAWEWHSQWPVVWSRSRGAARAAICSTRAFRSLVPNHG